jgi:hypothetical protein
VSFSCENIDCDSAESASMLPIATRWRSVAQTYKDFVKNGI